MQITSQLQCSEWRKTGRGSRKEAVTWGGVGEDSSWTEGRHSWAQTGDGQGRRGPIQQRAPPAVLSSWYLSQEGEWKREMRYLQLSSSSKNVSKIPRCVKTKMNREQCSPAALIQEERPGLLARDSPECPSSLPSSQGRAWASRACIRCCTIWVLDGVWARRWEAKAHNLGKYIFKM